MRSAHRYTLHGTTRVRDTQRRQRQLKPLTQQQLSHSAQLRSQLGSDSESDRAASRHRQTSTTAHMYARARAHSCPTWLIATHRSTRRGRDGEKRQRLRCVTAARVKHRRGSANSAHSLERRGWWIGHAVAAVDSPAIIRHAPLPVSARPLPSLLLRQAPANGQGGSLSKQTNEIQPRGATKLNADDTHVDRQRVELDERTAQGAPHSVDWTAGLSPATVSPTRTTGGSVDSESLTCRDEECCHIRALIRSGSQIALLSSPPSMQPASCSPRCPTSVTSNASLPPAEQTEPMSRPATDDLERVQPQLKVASHPASRRSLACVADASDLSAAPVWTMHAAEEESQSADKLPSLPVSYALLVAEPNQQPSSSGLTMVRRMKLPKLPALAGNKIAPLDENDSLPPCEQVRSSVLSQESSKVASSSPLLMPQPRRASFIKLPSLPSSTHFLPFQSDVAGSSLQSLGPSPEPSPPPKLRNGASVIVPESTQDATSNRRAPPIVHLSLCTPSPPPTDEPTRSAPADAIVALEPLFSSSASCSEPVLPALVAKSTEPAQWDGSEEQEVTLIRRPKGAKWSSRVGRIKQERLENEVAALASARDSRPAVQEPSATAASKDEPIAVIKPKKYQLPLAPRLIASTAPVSFDAMSPISQRASPVFPPTAAVIALARSAAPTRTVSANLDLPASPLAATSYSRDKATLPSQHSIPVLAGGASFSRLPSSGILSSPPLRTLVTYRAGLEEWDDNRGGRSLRDFQHQVQATSGGLVASKTVFELMQSGAFGATPPAQSQGLSKQSRLQPALHARAIDRPNPFDNLRHVKPPPLLILDHCFPKPSLEGLLQAARVQAVHSSLRQARDKRGAVAVSQVRLALPLPTSIVSAIDGLQVVQRRPLVPPLKLQPLLGPELSTAAATDRSSSRSCRSPQQLSERLFPITPRSQRSDTVQQPVQPVVQLQAPPPAVQPRHLLPQAPLQLPSTAFTLATPTPAHVIPSPSRPSTPAVAVDSVKLEIEGAVDAPTKAIVDNSCFSHDLSDLVALKPFIASLLTASSRGSGGIHQLTLFQSVPHKPLAIVEQGVWQILDAIILGAASVPSEQASGRVLTKLDLSDVTSEGIVRSTMKRMSVEAAKDGSLKGVGGGAAPGSAAPGRGVLKLQSLCLRLNFLAMNQPVFARATPIHALTIRALAAPGLTSLNLFQSNFGGKAGLEALVKSVLRSQTIKQLSLVSCSLARWGGQIAHLLQSHPTLTELNLSLNGLCDAEIAQCCALFTSPSSRVERLNLSLNNFGLQGLTAIADAVNGPNYNRRMTVLSLEGNQFASTNSACAAQVARLVRCRGLLELNVGYSGLILDDCRLVCAAVSDPACSLKFLGIAGLLSPARQVADRLGGLKGWQSGVEEILRSLSLNSTLTRIDLRDNKLMVTANAVKNDASTPRILQSLLSLALLNPTLEVLHLSDNGLTSVQSTLIQTQLHFKRDRQREVTLVQTARKLCDEAVQIELRAPSPRMPPHAAAKLAANRTVNLQRIAAPPPSPPPSCARVVSRPVAQSSLVSCLPARSAARALGKTSAIAALSTSPVLAPSSTSPPTLLPSQTRAMQSFHAAHHGGKTHGPVVARHSRPNTAIRLHDRTPAEPSKQQANVSRAQRSVAAISSGLQRAYEANAGAKYLRPSPFAPMVPAPHNEQLWVSPRLH